MIFDFANLGVAERYKLLASTIVPRPIAWVSTVSPEGATNVAPFSFFNVFGEDPPVVGFSVNDRSVGDRKDTGNNVRRTGEFVVNLVDERNFPAMNVTAIEFGPEIDEFVQAGLRPEPSVKVRPPRVASSPVSLECSLLKIVEFGPARSLVIGQVLLMHVADAMVLDPVRCHIDTPRMRLIGRMHGNGYTRTADLMELARIPVDQWVLKTSAEQA